MSNDYETLLPSSKTDEEVKIFDNATSLLKTNLLLRECFCNIINTDQCIIINQELSLLYLLMTLFLRRAKSSI